MVLCWPRAEDAVRKNDTTDNKVLGQAYEAQAGRMVLAPPLSHPSLCLGGRALAPWLKEAQWVLIKSHGWRRGLRTGWTQMTMWCLSQYSSFPQSTRAHPSRFALRSYFCSQLALSPSPPALSLTRASSEMTTWPRLASDPRETPSRKQTLTTAGLLHPATPDASCTSELSSFIPQVTSFKLI